MRKWLPAAVGLLALGPAAVRAAPDTVGVGTGRDGSLSVTTAGTVINAYAPLTAAVARKATALPVGPCAGGTCFAAGDLVLVYQGTGLVPAPASGAPGPFDVGASAVGHWEFARLAEVSATTLGLTAPLVQDYAASGAQVIRVPEYLSVTVSSAGSLVAPPWNGSVGGVVAFLSVGEVSNQGAISADGAGFRGGLFVAGDALARGCTELDDTAARAAQKGEGLGGTGFYGPTHAGRGNVGNGAGGAVCFRTGGGGGGNGGAGGQGGYSDLSDGKRDVGGLGGAAITLPAVPEVPSLLTRLLFGGGGGAGHGTSGSGVAGGAGGGAVFLRAGQLSGTGTLGASGGSAGTVTEGGSGGGAGGALYVRVVGSAGCALASTSGGIGSTSSSARVGPGGGGGAGQLLLQAAPGATCDLVSTGAASGGQLIPSDGAYGAQAGQSSTPSTLTYGFIIPTPPTVSTPLEGTLTNNARPPLGGTSPLYPQRPRPNTEVLLFIDGEQVGRVLADADGLFSFALPQDLAEGEHTLRVAAAVDAVQSLDSEPTRFVVDLTPPDSFFVSGPERIFYERNPRFEFGSNEEGVTYTCSLDGAEFGPCPASGVFADLPDGPHTVRVRARDRAGNEDESPATYAFRVAVADLALLGDGIGCAATGGVSSLGWLGLGLLAMGLGRRRHGGART